MFKRKRVYGDFADSVDSVVVYPSLESTVLLETGGDTGLNPGSSTTDLSGNLGGVRRLIYNDPFFSNDFFTTTLQNSLVALVVSIYTGGEYTTGLIPIMLPRQGLRHEMSQEDFESKRDFVKIQKSIAYGLNLMFSKTINVLYWTGTEMSTVPLPPAAPFFPLVQDTVLPPLLWGVTEATGQLYLRRNDAFVKPTLDFDIAFNLFNFNDLFCPPLSSSNNRITGTRSGWFAKGAYVYGFGTLNTTDHYYVDEYFGKDQTFYDSLRQIFVLGTVDTETAWDQNVVQAFSLRKNFLVGTRTCTAIHSRYMTLDSQQLSRIQKRPTTSNTDTSMAQSIAIIYDIIDNSGKYQDGKDLISSVPIIFFDPVNYSNNEVDLRFVDEFQDVLFAWDKDQYYSQSITETLDFIPSIGTVPVPYQVLDPYNATNGPRFDCLFPYQRINTDFIVETVTNGNRLNYNEVWAGKPSQSATHFLRVIGS